MTAKRIVRDDEILGYEVTAKGLQPMNAEQYEAFIKVGLDQLARGEFFTEAEMDVEFERMLVDLPPSNG